MRLRFSIRFEDQRVEWTPELEALRRQTVRRMERQIDEMIAYGPRFPFLSPELQRVVVLTRHLEYLLAGMRDEPVAY